MRGCASPAIVISMLTPDFLGWGSLLSPGSPKELEDGSCTHFCCGCLGTVVRNLLGSASSLSTGEVVKPFSAPEAGPDVRALLSSD